VITDEDSEAVARFLNGDAAAFDLLFSRYQDYVYHIIYGIVGSAEDARDLTQDVFLQVYRSLGQFKRGSRFATWLYRIAVNKAVDAARGSRRWRFLPLFDTPGILERKADSELEPEATYVRGEKRNAIQATLMMCPVNHREVLVLKYYRELSVEEIADTLRCSVSAAKVRLHRARKVFKEHYAAVPGYSEETSGTDADGVTNHVNG